MKTKSLLFNSFTALLFVFLMISCGKNTDNAVSKKSISPPSQVLAKDFEKLTIQNPADSSYFKLSGGTILQIPQSAFVDAEGNPVTGKVSLQYKEYKDAVDILGSGIPMEYDSAGERILQTAGMFELYGYNSSGEPVYIHPEKNIKISMLSSVKETDYNFYIYDTIQANWKYINRSTTSKLVSEMKEVEVGEKMPPPPIAPQQYDPKGFVLDMQINTTDFPELSSMKGLMWQYSGNDEKNDPKKNQWIFAKNWNEIKLQLVDAEKSLFQLTLSDAKTTFQTTVIPVLAGKNYSKAIKKYNAKYEEYSIKYADRIAKEQEKKKMQDMFYRTVGIGNFGIYNHDRIFKNESSRIAAKFELENGEPLEDVTIYHLYGAAATVVRYPANKWNAFAYTKTGGNCLVAFLKNGKAAVFTNQDFRKLDTKKVAEDKSITFKLNSSPGVDIDPEALRKMIKI